MKSGYQTYPDSQLLTLLSRNDHAAFEEIYSRYAKNMYVVAVKTLGRESAEDAVQEIFVSIWKRRSRLNISQCLGGYLAASIKYYVLRAYKEEKRSAAFQEKLNLVTKKILEDDPVIYQDIQSVLRKLLSGFPNDHQVIYRLSRDYHLTYSEIACHLEISIKTVEKKISKVLRSIRPQMDKLLIVVSLMNYM